MSGADLAPSETAPAGPGILLDPLAGYRVAICWLSATRLPPRLQVFELREGDERIEMTVPLRAST